MKFLTKLFLYCIPDRIRLYLKNLGRLEALAVIDNANRHLNRSFSQEGEDLILQRFFREKADGFFIDVGAHHPKRFSNTYLFYEKGWNGINIDATPGSMDEFNATRDRDLNLEVPISSEEQCLEFYIFNEPALNTLDKELALQKDGWNGFKLVHSVTLRTRTLRSLLDEYLAVGQQIDFLTIDVEGFDLQVLASNDWSRYRPTIIIVEDLFLNIGEVLERPVYKLLISVDYVLFAKTINSLFFKENRFN